METTITKRLIASLASGSCKRTKLRFVVVGADASNREANKLRVTFAKARTTRISIRCRWREIVILGLWLISGPLHGQIAQLTGASPRETQRANAPAVLPKTTNEIDGALARIESRLSDVRVRISAPKTTEAAAVSALAATPDELTEREELLQQWVIALDQQGRYLRSLTEIRRVNQERIAEEEAWRGFAQTPTLIVAEQLTDAVSARRLELRTAQMLLSISEGEIARYSARLTDSHKQLRLAKDSVERGTVQDSRRQWLIQLAQLRNQADEAAVESAEIGRLVTWEALDGQRKHLEFLERKLAAARAQARITKSDLDGLLSQINEKRAALQKELNEAISTDKALRATRDAAVAKARAVQSESAVELQAAAEVEQARVETSGRKVESLHGFLQLADHARTVWEDRLWATEQRSLRQLRARQRHYEQLLAGLRQWKSLMEQSLSAVSDQMLRQALKAENSMLTSAERDSAKRIHATLQERAWVELRAVGALVFTEDLTARLHAEISEQVTRVSVVGKLNSIWEDIRAFVRSIWNTELYIAEDSIIAGGQKVSIPRSITLGKVVIALTIFAVGLLAARWAYQLARRLSSRWFTQQHQTSDVPAKAFAAIVALVSLLVAMASVRIPWTVFAFMGGALAIGVGFGAQTLINNFISGVILLCERSIRVGDIVEVDDQRGKIVRVGFRNSLVSRGDGIEVLVPNSQFLEKKVVNWTLSNDLVRYAVSVGVAFGSPLTKVSELIAQAAAEHPHLIKEPAPDVLLEDFGDNALVFSLQFWMRLRPGVDGGRVRSELRHRINELFNDAEIRIAFPQRDIHLDTNRPLEIKLLNSPTARATDVDRARSVCFSHEPHGGARSRADVATL